jgi:hypothetical protein
MNFGGMAANPNEVRIYSLGGITNLIKFSEIEKTLLDIMKAYSIPASAVKLAIHEATNVLVVTGDGGVHNIVNQFLDALQKNAAVAAAEEKNNAKHRQEALELMIRLDAEKQQRARVEKQLEEAEQAYREARRELDRVKTGAPKGQ